MKISVSDPLKSVMTTENFCLYKRNTKRKGNNAWKHSWSRRMSAAVLGEFFWMCNRQNGTPPRHFHAEHNPSRKHIAETADSICFCKRPEICKCHELYTTNSQWVEALITTKNKRKITYSANNWWFMTESNPKCNKLRSLQWLCKSIYPITKANTKNLISSIYYHRVP